LVTGFHLVVSSLVKAINTIFAAVSDNFQPCMSESVLHLRRALNPAKVNVEQP
jgi:hypothetical protein